MNKKVILLNGPSSSGKSTLANILKKNIKIHKEDEYPIISIDDFLKMSVDDVIYEDDVYDISPMLCQKAKEILEINQGIIIDHVITSERIFNHLRDSFSHCDLYLIQVTCPIEILKSRESSRGNRHIGSAEASYRYLYPQEGYHLTVDTSKESMEACSQRILYLLDN